jgi:oligopeptide/dipeptide ABC transporter ATP-binding protein
VTIQAQILTLIRELQEEFGMSVLLITHDLGVVAQTAHQVCVMYAGKVVERAATRELFKRPHHPYTVGLFRSIPKLGRRVFKLDTIPGMVPSALEFPKGCRFNNRCPFATDKCLTDEPALREIGTPDEPHQVACHYAEEVTGEEWHRRSQQNLATAGGAA